LINQSVKIITKHYAAYIFVVNNLKEQESTTI